MLPSSLRGDGRFLGMIGDTSDLVPRAEVLPSDPVAPMLADWTFQSGPPTPIQIPYTWLSPPLRSRPDKPLTVAEVTSGGVTTPVRDAPSAGEYGENLFTATLASPLTIDGVNLANWIIDYYATQPGAVPRTRFPALALKLNARTRGEQMRILAVTIGTRITITGAPTTWPAGATEQVVEGIHHSHGPEDRVVEWNTAPVVGASAGTAGPWFRFGVSVIGGTDVIPF